MIVECPRCHARYDVGARRPGTRLRCRCGEIFALKAASGFAEVLKCPQCGAASAPDATECAYCHAALGLVGCPRCMGRVFQGSRFCPHCGAGLEQAARPADAIAVERHCPRCPEPQPKLLAHAVGDAVLDECPACGGTWVDTGTVDRLVKDSSRYATLFSEHTGLATVSEPRGPGPRSPSGGFYERCPECHVLMNRVNFGHCSGVLTQVCRAHGTWFEKGDLARALEFVRAGGLEQARKREVDELERRAQALRQEERDRDAQRGLYEAMERRELRFGYPSTRAPGSRAYVATVALTAVALGTCANGLGHSRTSREVGSLGILLIVVLGLWIRRWLGGRGSPDSSSDGL